MNLTTKSDWTSQQPSPPQILVVNDEQEILPEYEEFFEFAGFPTITCADPVEAFDLVLSITDIKVVITDLRMAQLDGASMIRDLRAALPSQRRLDFLILTGDASAQLMNDIADVPVFLKPADTDALVAAIRAALSRP